MSLFRKSAAVVAAMTLAVPVAAVTSTANAGTAPPPCTKKAIKKAIKKAEGGVAITVTAKRCKMYWAAASYDVRGAYDAAALLTDNGGVWKVVGPRREAKLCKDSNTTVPKVIKKRACVS